jgi:hypothetical protein
MKRFITISFLALAACGTPASNDVLYEITDASNGIVAKTVVLKTSASLKSGSLSDASELWLGNSFRKTEGHRCKDVAPSDWRDVVAFDIEGAIVEAKANKSYNLRICATQLSNPKRIGAIGFVVSSQKLEPMKP